MARLSQAAAIRQTRNVRYAKDYHEDTNGLFRRDRNTKRHEHETKHKQQKERQHDANVMEEMKMTLMDARNKLI